jgi:hypothetical protein
MAKPKATPATIEVHCPCCQATLKIDIETKAVLSHKEAEKPKMVEDLAAAVTRLKGESARREEAFQKSVAEHKDHAKVLDRKFDELLKQAKEDPKAPPKRAFDFD